MSAVGECVHDAYTLFFTKISREGSCLYSAATEKVNSRNLGFRQTGFSKRSGKPVEPYDSILSTHCARHSGASNGCAKYHLSRHIFPSRSSLMTTKLNTRPSP